MQFNNKYTLLVFEGILLQIKDSVEATKYGLIKVVSRSVSVTPASPQLLPVYSFVIRNLKCDFMVLLGAVNPSVCKGPLSGLNIETATNLTLENIFSKLCKACQLKTMASIPPSAFSAGRIRESQRDERNMKLSKTSKGNEPTKSFDVTYMELSPLKYCCKLMNSIWGYYNRYSPHNVKKINDANPLGGADAHQSVASSANKAEPSITLPPTKFDKFWSFLSQSH